MMSRTLIAMLMAGAAVPVQATVHFEIDANVTMTSSMAGPYPPVSGPSVQHFSLSADTLTSRFVINTLPFSAGPPCAMFGQPCIDLARGGDTWQFTSSMLGGAYQGLNITLKFSENVDGASLDQAMTKYVSGTFNWFYGHHNGGAMLAGPIVGIAAFVPEPAIWALMIGGFALTGAALRRPRMTVAYA